MRAACSGEVVTEYLVNPSIIGLSAAEAVAHSEGKGALSQEVAFGTIERSWGRLMGSTCG